MGYLFIRGRISREVIGKDGDRSSPAVRCSSSCGSAASRASIPGAQFPGELSVCGFPVSLAVTVMADLRVRWACVTGARSSFFANAMFPPGMPRPSA